MTATATQCHLCDGAGRVGTHGSGEFPLYSRCALCDGSGVLFAEPPSPRPASTTPGQIAAARAEAYEDAARIADAYVTDSRGDVTLAERIRERARGRR